MKILFIGDIHIRALTPRNRKDDYLKTLCAKLRECWKIANSHNVAAVLQPGDIFHSPEVSIQTLLTAVEVFKECPVPFYTVPGNHDLFGWNLKSFDRTSLKLLELLCQNTDREKRNEFNVVLESFNYASGCCYLDFLNQVCFKPYTSDIDSSGTGYSGDFDDVSRTATLVAHGMLLDHDLPYEARYTNLFKLETNADIILSGHDHVGFGAIKRQDGKLFVNPGALMRLTASEAEMQRVVQVAVVDTDARTAELVPLTTALPADEVLDRSKLEEKEERRYAMEEFAALIKTNQGTAMRNLDEIVEELGKQDSVEESIIAKAVDLLREARS